MAETFYNGYSPQERKRKLAASHQQFPDRSKHPCSKPPCHMCDDPSTKVAPHSEDYSVPYCFEPPSTRALCGTCNARIHKRFAAPASWLAYKCHLRRGGYGSDLKKSGKIAREISRLAKALEAGKPFELAPMPRNKNLTGTEWWEILSTDAQTLTERSARPSAMTSPFTDHAAFLRRRQFLAKGALGASALVLTSARRIFRP